MFRVYFLTERIPKIDIVKWLFSKIARASFLSNYIDYRA